MSLAGPSFAEFRQKLQARGLDVGLADRALGDRAKALPLGLRAIDEALPEAGLPRGAVVEIASPRGLARATSFALLACASAQDEARLLSGARRDAQGGARREASERGALAMEGAWCAWVDPAGTLYAPAVARAGVDLARLLVVRPPAEALARVAVRVAASRAFQVIVIDAAGVPGAEASPRGERLDRWATVVRRLALAVEGCDALVLLMTDRGAARAMPLPVAMRIELDRLGEDRLTLRVAKDRRGRVTAPSAFALPPSLRMA